MYIKACFSTLEEQAFTFFTKLCNRLIDLVLLLEVLTKPLKCKGTSTLILSHNTSSGVLHFFEPFNKRPICDSDVAAANTSTLSSPTRKSIVIDS